ncbi:ATPase domain-containing protein [Blautia hydrogenotrophica]|uniref:ATPase domain-containing protein n=1 Tax=Blautia hydrogenotrophica TaxID=53443 RepID=UPI003AB76479
MEIYKFDREDAIRFGREIRARYCVKGDELRFDRCPYCLGGSNGKDKGTFSINLDTGQFKCLRASCDAHGNMITLARDFNFSLGTEVDEYYSPKKRFRNIHRKEKPQTKPAAVKYLESRGISEETAKRYNITTQKDNENILVFPFYDENNILQFVKYRKTDFDKDRDKNKEWCERNCKPILFGMNHCDPEQPTLVLTEGQIDSLSCAEAGIKNAVSVPNGAKGFTWIPYCWDFLSRFANLVIFGDFEHEAISLLPEMQKRFHGTVKHIREDDYRDCKDANEILQKYGPEYLQKCVENAVPVSNPKIKPLEEVKRMDLNAMEKIRSGIYGLDKLTGGFYFGQVILVTGERGFGKSTLVSQFGTQAIAAGYPTFFYSGELMDWYFKAWIEYQIAGARNINALISDYGYKSYSIQADKLQQIENWYAGKAYIYDNGIVTEDTEEETLLETLENAIKQYGCRVLVIDNLMTAISDDLSSDLYRMQTKFVKALTVLAKRYDVLVFLIVHPRKSTGVAFDNDDVAGSSNITNLVDVVIRYGKPKDNDKKDSTERILSVYKNRLNGRTNRDGIKLYFQESSKRISENPETFDWELGWEKEEFVTVPDDFEPIFD